MAAGLAGFFLSRLFFTVFTETTTAFTDIVLHITYLIFISGSCIFLVILHIRLKEDILHVEDKFHKVFNTAPHPMNIAKLYDATILEANSAFLRVSGYTMEEAIGKSTISLGLWNDPKQRNDFVAALVKYQTYGPVEYKFIPKSGKPTKFLVYAQIIIIKGEQYYVAHLEEKYDKTHASIETMNLLRQRLTELMVNEALYKTPGITLPDLADKLETNKTYLSQVINSEYGNFNEYLNKFRVIEACRLIQNGLDPRFNIDHIYLDVGFSSRTTFYNAFKKHTGVSPSRFLQINARPVSTKSTST